jgi:predicted nuclease of predicted toxin-antitoxin system
VRVLLDEQLPRQLASYVVGHDARTVQQQGWAGLKNGELLKQAETRGFEIFLTADQSLEFQQNLTHSRLFVIVLVAPSNALEDLLPAVPAALAAMAEPKAGQVIRVGS